LTLRDACLAIFVSVLWGLAFVAIRFGLDSFSPGQLTAIRFIIACLPAAFLPRPRLPWASLLLIGMTLFAGQFLLLFFAYAQGMPPGLASVVMQMQAFFTVIIAAVWLRDRPTRKQLVGMAVAFVGLALIGGTVGADLTFVALALTVAAALSWAVGNVLVKREPGTPILPLIVWLSLVPPLPALAVSIAFEGGEGILGTVAAASWLSIGSAVYLGALATTLAYAIWSHLLRRHSTAAVAPFALLAPCVGVVASAIVFGERFDPVRYIGMAGIALGLAIIVLPWSRLPLLRRLVR
jgi:O-acetylserine/cysteine efflux transporter